MGDLISYGVAFILLIILYKTVISPFSKKMLEVDKDDHGDLEYNGITFDDLDLDKESEEDLKIKIKTVKKKINSLDGVDEDSVRYDILLQKLKEITENDTDGTSKILSDLVRDKEEP